MKILTSEITKLLDKLYNLRGENSVILSEMAKEKEKAEITKEKNETEKAVLQDKIEKLTEEETILGDEGQKLSAALSKINAEDFRFVLDKLNIDFDPNKISNDVNSLLPATISKVKEEKESAKSELVKIEAEMNTAITTIEELGIRKDEALANQARLNEYFELALNGNINITRDSITSLLEKFDFNEDERREAAKILMFPEDALYEYENNLKSEQEPGKSISEVIAEAKEPFANDEQNSEFLSENIKISPSLMSESVQPSVNVTPKENLTNILTELGFDYLDFTNNDIDKILVNYNENDLRDNVKFAKDNNLRLDMFVDNVELLYDKELRDKVNKLVEIGKEPFDIYLNPNILIKYTKKDLDETIERLKNSGLDPKKVPLIAY